MKQQNTQPADAPVSRKKQILFILLFIAIAALSIWAVVSQSKDFSLSDFGSYIHYADKPWLFAAVASMLGFIVFEGLALQVLCRAFGYRSTFRQGFIYSASDIYFSAITPSASGGQPASAYFMMKNGIDGMMTTVILLINLVMYTSALVVICLLCFILRFNLFLQFSLLSKVLIVAGCAIMLGLLLFFYMLLKKDYLLQKLCLGTLNLLCRLHILRHQEKKQEKVLAYMDQYRQYSKLISGHRKTLFVCFIFNLLQRTSQIAVTMFVYTATTGNNFFESIDLWFLQAYAVLGSNFMPIPGGIGISDGLMIDGFQHMMSKTDATYLDLLSRSFSFYSCVIICGIAMVAQYCANKRREKHL